MDMVEKAFKQTMLFNLDEIKESFKDYMTYVVENEEGRDSPHLIQNKVKLCAGFYKKLQNCHLPELDQDWWFYEYEYTGTGFELWMRKMEEAEIDEEGNLSSWMVGDGFKLLSIECGYLSVEEFASVHGVSPVTVRQWIRRGKLRYAKKIGGEWRIPEISDKPERGFHFVQYFIDEDNPLQLDSFPFVQYADCITIYQDLKNRKQFKCEFSGKEIKNEMLLTRKEVEELELALIASGKAKPNVPIQWTPTKE